jgi:hypothetical protein
MTLDEAIAGLERAREALGGDAGLFMVDYEPVTEFSIIGGCVFVTDAPPEELAEENTRRDDIYVLTGDGVLEQLPYRDWCERHGDAIDRGW